MPGAIENAGAIPVFIEIKDDYLTDLEDLEKKAVQSGAKFFLGSHMRGHVVGMDRVTEICHDLNIALLKTARIPSAAGGEKYLPGVSVKLVAFPARHTNI